MTSPTLAAPIVAVRLPIPPSVNHLYRNVPGQGRVKTRNYEHWEQEARYTARWPRITEDPTNRLHWLAAYVVHGLPYTRDLSNCIKATEDFLCTMTGLRDAYCDLITIERSKDTARSIEVAVWLIEEKR